MIESQEEHSSERGLTVYDLLFPLVFYCHLVAHLYD